MKKIIAWAERFLFPPIKLLHAGGYIILLLLMFLTVGDIFGRKLAGVIPAFNPIPGTFELTEYALIVIIFASIGYTQVKGEHISIDIITSRFPKRTRAILEIFMYTAAIIIFTLVAWQSLVYAGRLREGNFVSGVLSIPQYPFAIMITIGSIIYCLALLVGLLGHIVTARESNKITPKVVKDVA